MTLHASTEKPIVPGPDPSFGWLRPETRATCMLIGVTLLWGMSFPLMKSWQEAATSCPGGMELASFTLIALRMLLALLTWLLVRPRPANPISWHEHRIGLTLGTTFFLGFSLQVLGLNQTTPALSALLTSLGSVWVPLLGYWWYRNALSPLTLVGLCLGITGVGWLSEFDYRSGWKFGAGEGMTVLASLFFAVQIVLLSHWGSRVRADVLTLDLFAVTGLSALVLAVGIAASGPGLDAWLAWLHGMLQDRQFLVALGLLTAFSTLIAFHLMNVYQPRVPAARAAVIYLLEPVFATAISVAVGYDHFTFHLFLGASLILAGNLLAELAPWFRLRLVLVTDRKTPRQE
jgi:drug/metabolite transporter (DMT)-like permease